jgi:hypothetical protein
MHRRPSPSDHRRGGQAGRLRSRSGTSSRGGWPPRRRRRRGRGAAGSAFQPGTWWEPARAGTRPLNALPAAIGDPSSKEPGARRPRWARTRGGLGPARRRGWRGLAWPARLRTPLRTASAPSPRGDVAAGPGDVAAGPRSCSRPSAPAHHQLLASQEPPHHPPPSPPWTHKSPSRRNPPLASLELLARLTSAGRGGIIEGAAPRTSLAALDHEDSFERRGALGLQSEPLQ